MSYDSLDDVKGDRETLVENICIAVKPSRRLQWQRLKEFYWEKNINIAVNLRHAILEELDKLQAVKDKNE